MNERKDILERVKHLMKENSEIKVNCSKLARQLNCDRRTVSRYIDITRSGKEASQREYPKKTDGFEHIIEEKVKTTAPAIAIYNYLAKEHGYTGSYSTIKRYIHNLNIEKQRDAVIHFETNPGIQAQVDWKESLKFKTKDGETIKFNIFLLILGFSRTKFLMVTETRDLQQVELCLTHAFKYLGGVPHEILFDNMRSIIDKARTQYSEPVFNENFKVFAEDCGFIPKACVAYRPETKGKIEVTAKLMNRIKVYSGDITCFDDIKRIASELNREINLSVCQATSMQSSVLKGIAKVSTSVGKFVEKIPVISNSQADEALKTAGGKLDKINAGKLRNQMNALIAYQSNLIKPFIENINTVNELYNKPVQLLVDKENLYLATIS